MEFWLPLILIGVVVIVMVALGVVLRRRRAAAAEEPPEIGSPTDYTSLPIEEPTGWRERFGNLSLAGKALLVLVPLLVIVGGVVLVLALGAPTTPVETPADLPPPPAPEITIASARVINPQTIAIRADSTLPPDTPVEAALLANNEPFAWFDPASASGQAGPNGEIDVRLTRLADAPQASSEVSYTVALKAQIDGKDIEAVSALSVPSIYARNFYEQPVAEAPTPAPVEPTAAPEPTPEPAEPTPEPEPPAEPALTGSVFNGGNVRDQPRVSGSQVLDQINAGESVQLLQQTADGSWYQIQNIRGVVGWVSVSLLDPIAPDTAAQVPAQGNPPLPTSSTFATPGAAEPPPPADATPTPSAPLPTLPSGLSASVFNGGNVRDQPRVNGSQVLDQINAGENVQLLQKTADGTWYQIRNERGVVGWVNVTLLTIDPSVAARVPVAPVQ